MELGIKNSHIGFAGHQLFASFDTGEVGGVVQRAEGEAVTDNLLDLFSDQHGSSDFFAAMEHTVTDGNDLVQISDNTHFGIDQLFADLFKSVNMVSDLDDLFKFEAVGFFVDQIGIVSTDTLKDTLGENGLFFHFEQRELHGTAAGIDD